MAIGIPGINENVFHELLDDDEDLFVTILRTFVEKTPDTLRKLTNPTKETLADYATRVHGVKGACANICAEEAKKMAFELEQMSRDGDLSGVLAKNGPFLNYMEDLMGRLNNWLKSKG